MYPNYPNIYGLPNAIPHSKYHNLHNMSILSDTIASHKQLHSSVNRHTMSRLAQSASIIQGQMAASQIPLCIVQDQSGQLHQLVYMVPDHLYQSYIAAAARGNIVCYLRSLLYQKVEIISVQVPLSMLLRVTSFLFAYLTPKLSVGREVGSAHPYFDHVKQLLKWLHNYALHYFTDAPFR